MSRPARTAGLDSYGTAGTLSVGDDTFRIQRLDGLPIDALPYSLRVVLENVLRHEDGRHVTTDQVRTLLTWADAPDYEASIDLSPSRVFLHDTNGVPTVVDLAAMRHAMTLLGADPARVNPLIPAELVIDHSVIADVFGRADARERNVEIEYSRNSERYRFLRWGQQTLQDFAVVPPGLGIMHQINIEYLARVVMVEQGWAFPDVCLGTDSHTTMVNGLGVLGWGIGGIEAEAVMLGQSLSMVLPQVVGFRLHGELREGATATDLVLTITEQMRRHGVVGKFVEFYGPGVTALTLADRATIANMSPEFGSTCAYFPIDDETLHYLRFTGRSAESVALVEAYAKEQGLWHDPSHAPVYSELAELDLGSVVPSLAGPRRPQDRVRLDDAQRSFRDVLPDVLGLAAPDLSVAPVETMPDRPSRPVQIVLDGVQHTIDHGSVAIAAITSCTNTSNPSVMVAAGLVARNAVRRGLRSKEWVKTSLSPGSRAVTDYLDDAGLTPFLDELGFHLTGFGCMTCIGASGPLIDEVTQAVHEHDLGVVSVLSGNRNFEGRINPDVRMNYLASPPLVVAYALAGTMDTDLVRDPLGTDESGRPVHLRDIWPTSAEVQEIIDSTMDPSMLSRAYDGIFDGDERWRDLVVPAGETFAWDADSTYLRRPPYLDGVEREPGPLTRVEGARVLVKLGDSVTTDHVSPAGAIPVHTPAGQYLTGLGVERFQLNTYASRRGNHEVMMRGTFANVRLRNQLVPGIEGGSTRNLLTGEVCSVFDAAAAYRSADVPLLILAGKDYGSGSSRDWAAKGPALLGVRAVLAESFERIHRSNLIGMGILPLQFLPGESAQSHGLDGTERFELDVQALDGDTVPTTIDVRAGSRELRMTPRLDTSRDLEYFRHGGIMKYVLRELLRV